MFFKCTDGDGKGIATPRVILNKDALKQLLFKIGISPSKIEVVISKDVVKSEEYPEKNLLGRYIIVPEHKIEIFITTIALTSQNVLEFIAQLEHTLGHEVGHFLGFSPRRHRLATPELRFWKWSHSLVNSLVFGKRRYRFQERCANALSYCLLKIYYHDFSRVFVVTEKK